MSKLLNYWQARGDMLSREPYKRVNEGGGGVREVVAERIGSQGDGGMERCAAKGRAADLWDWSVHPPTHRA